MQELEKSIEANFKKVEVRIAPNVECPALSIVIPTRNEADNIKPLYDRIAAVADGLNCECVFVDDSDDQTREQISALSGNAHLSVKCLTRDGVDRKGGLSTAVVAGIRHSQGEFVVVIDSDLQHPPEMIPRLLQIVMNNKFDLAVASRYMAGGSNAGLSGLIRNLVSRLSTLVIHLLFPSARSTSDPLSGFFLIRRTQIDINRFQPTGFKILLEILVTQAPLRVVDLPFAMDERHSGQSKASVREGLRFMKHIWLLITNVKRH